MSEEQVKEAVEKKEWSKEIKQIGDKIVALTLMQAKELGDYLKDEYGIEPAAGGAVMMAGPAAGGEVLRRRTSSSVQYSSTKEVRSRCLTIPGWK